MNKQELINHISDLFDDNSIGIIGKRNDNGADSYYCPCCGASENIMGYVSTGINQMTNVTHEEDCELNKLYNYVNQCYDNKSSDTQDKQIVSLSEWFVLYELRFKIHINYDNEINKYKIIIEKKKDINFISDSIVICGMNLKAMFFKAVTYFNNINRKNNLPYLIDMNKTMDTMKIELV